MTAQLKLVRTADGISDIDTVNLLSGGFSLVADGYAPAVAPIGAKSVHESITLTLKGTSVDDLAFMVQDIDRKIKECQWWLDNPDIERYQVWIRAQMDGETYARQAQILNIEPANKVNEFTKQETGDYTIVEYTFGIERTPFWEQPYPYPTTTALTSINAESPTSATQLVETINGDVPARLYKFSFTPATESGASYRGWFGFKTSRFGNPANFLPSWSVTNKYQLGADTTVGSGLATCTFATVSTMAQRVVFRLGGLTANPNDQRGVYTVLMRALTTSGTVARARIRYALGLGSLAYTPIYRNSAPINPVVAGDYDVYELGDIVIPPKQATASDDLSEFYVALDVERVSGAGSFYTPGFTLIPKEAMIRTVQQYGAGYFAVSDVVSTWQRADNDVISYRLVSGVPNDILVSTPHNWGLPANNERPYLVAVLDNKEVSLGSVTIDVTYTYIPRWRTLRGTGAYGT